MSTKNDVRPPIKKGIYRVNPSPSMECGYIYFKDVDVKKSYADITVYRPSDGKSESKQVDSSLWDWIDLHDNVSFYGMPSKLWNLFNQELSRILTND